MELHIPIYIQLIPNIVIQASFSKNLKNMYSFRHVPGKVITRHLCKIKILYIYVCVHWFVLNTSMDTYIAFSF